MKNHSKFADGFTLIELLVAIAVVAILAALLFPVISTSQHQAHRVTCLNNLRQINLGVRMYSDDSNGASPSPGVAATNTDSVAPLYAGYEEIMKNYVGIKGTSPTQDKLFACPEDKFFPAFITNGPPLTGYVRQSFHDLSYSSFSSYMFNGGDNLIRNFGTFTVTLPGLSGVKLSAIKHPSRTALVSEYSASAPWSWHEPAPGLKSNRANSIAKLMFSDARNGLSYVDGHVSYVKIYWNNTPYPGGTYSLAAQYDPPASYDYQWSPN